MARRMILAHGFGRQFDDWRRGGGRRRRFDDANGLRRRRTGAARLPPRLGGFGGLRGLRRFGRSRLRNGGRRLDQARQDAPCRTGWRGRRGGLGERARGRSEVASCAVRMGFLQLLGPGGGRFARRAPLATDLHDERTGRTLHSAETFAGIAELPGGPGANRGRASGRGAMLRPAAGKMQAAPRPPRPLLTGS